MNPDEVLKTQEVCDLLRISKQAIFKAVAEGRLPVLKLSPRAWRFRRADVLKLFQQEAGHDVSTMVRRRVGALGVDRVRRLSVRDRHGLAGSPSGKSVSESRMVGAVVAGRVD